MNQSQNINNSNCFVILRNVQKKQFSLPFQIPSNNLSICRNEVDGLEIKQNRKENSLEGLSKKFLRYFLSKTKKPLFKLDEITQKLNVERRRIYDIINIMECLNAIEKIDKNQFQWIGISSIIQKVQNIVQTESFIVDKDFFSPKNFSFFQNQQQESKFHKRGKCLETLTKKFIQLLSSKKILSLDEAAKHMQLKLSNDEKVQTKIRRLYDIANALKSLCLIKKTILPDKKPAFEWLGVINLEERIIEKYQQEIKVLNDQPFVMKTILKQKEQNSPSLFQNTTQKKNLELQPWKNFKDFTPFNINLDDTQKSKQIGEINLQQETTTEKVKLNKKVNKINSEIEQLIPYQLFAHELQQNSSSDFLKRIKLILSQQ